MGAEPGEGVVVTRVAPGSSAAEAGMRTGDVILEVDKHESSNVAALEQQLADADDGALLLVRRGEQTIFVPLKPPTS
jgi:S1-C subfamily serine protease